VEIEKRILLKHYEQATLEQLASEYRLKGYEVFQEKEIENHRFDLVAKKGDETIIFEIKAGSWIADKRQAVQQLRNFAVHKLGAKFKLVLVSLPKEPEIEIEGLEAIFSGLLAEHFINEFSRLATHFFVDEVSDIKFDELYIKKTEYDIKGSGTVAVGLQYGSDSDYKNDDGLRWTESFQFDFHLLLDENLEVKEIYELEINMSPEPE
jgi:hypothetical protein